MDTNIADTLRKLGITKNYRGYKLTFNAVRLVIDDSDRLLSVTASIYIPVSVSCSCKPQDVERNIRTVILRAWHVNRQFLFDIAGFPLSAPPAVSAFIDIIAGYVSRTNRQ